MSKFWKKKNFFKTKKKQKKKTLSRIILNYLLNDRILEENIKTF